MIKCQKIGGRTIEFIEKQLIVFKQMIEQSIIDKGVDGKQSMIRSSELINLIHNAVKYELIKQGINREKIFPPFNKKSPEIKMAGYLKQKNQDICVLPTNMEKKPIIIDWGPLAFENKLDPYGYEFSNNSLVINVRSQMSSLAKNTDTLFERTFAEADNLHMRYNEIVLGEVYLIPTHEYDDNLVKENKVGFKTNNTNIEKYISFFNSINNRKLGQASYLYERCALLIVDFNREVPKLYKNSQELKEDGLISKHFAIEYSTLAFNTFSKDILNIYSERHDLNNLK